MKVRAWPWVLVVVAMPPAAAWFGPVGCGTELRLRPGEGGGGEGDDPGLGGGGEGATGLGGSEPDAGPDAFDAYVDPGCPDQPPPVEDYACDPYAQDNGDCMPGDGCYIFVEYPAEPCGQEVYGAQCLPQGPGGQGDPCGGPLDCQGGHVCVITGSGIQCVQFCNLEGESGCPEGLICEQIDVEGFGGCL